MYREITMIEIREVLRLRGEGLPKKRIAAQLGLDPKTVRRYLTVAQTAGARVKSVRRLWEGACSRAGLTGFQLRDLRHEAGSRFDEAGVPVNFVSRLLGHTNLTTTSRYLNIHRRGLHMAMQKFEESRKLASSLQERPQNDSATAGEPPQGPAAKCPVS